MLLPNLKISESRRLLENPYAYLDGDGGYSFGEPISTFQIDLDEIRDPQIVGQYVSFEQIEKTVKLLQNEVWKKRQQIWGSNAPKNLNDALDPEMVFKTLGYRFEIVGSLGQVMSSRGLVDIAGFIDKSEQYVGISSHFSQPIQNFTAAHELGHAVLHGAIGMHRDRDYNGGATLAKLERVEVEANKFAGCLLMPEKLVLVEFQKRFRTKQFVVSEDTAFSLIQNSESVLRSEYTNLRKLARKLAETEQFDTKFFEPLHRLFRVSIEAMAIRLEELRLLSL